MEEGSQALNYVAIGLSGGALFGAMGYGFYRLNKFYNAISDTVQKLSEDVSDLREDVSDLREEVDDITGRVGNIEKALDIIEKKVYIIEEVRKVTYDVAIDGILDRVNEEKITTIEENPELIQFNKHPVSLYS